MRHSQESIPTLFSLVQYWILSFFRYESVCHGGLYNHHYYLGSRDKILDLQRFPEETYFYPQKKTCSEPPKATFVSSP